MLNTDGAALRGRVGGHVEKCGMCERNFKVFSTDDGSIYEGEEGRNELFGIPVSCVPEARRGDHGMQCTHAGLSAAQGTVFRLEFPMPSFFPILCANCGGS